jgi:polar amino acid transport system substrate-binding protein
VATKGLGFTNRLAVAGALGVLVTSALLVAGCGGAGTSSAPSPTPSSVSRLSVPPPAEVQQKGKLVVGVKCDYPPFGYADASGQAVGYEIDLVHRMALYAFGNPNAVDLQCVVAANRIQFLTSGRVDMLMATLTYTPQRAQTIAFSNPYFTAAGRLLMPKSSTIKEATDLGGRTLITATGSVYVTYAQNCLPGTKLLQFTQTADALAALTDGRGQAFMQDDTLLVDLAARNPNLKMVGSGVAQGPWGIGIRLGDTPLLNWVNAALAEMQKEDFNWKNFQRWIPDRSAQQKFASAVPRPGQTLRYGQGPVTTCTR